MYEGLEGGITADGSRLRENVWNIPGQGFYPRLTGASSFAFETDSEPGPRVPVRVRPAQDAFVLKLEGAFQLKLEGRWTKAVPLSNVDEAAHEVDFLPPEPNG